MLVHEFFHDKRGGMKRVISSPITLGITRNSFVTGGCAINKRLTLCSLFSSDELQAISMNFLANLKRFRAQINV